MSSQSLRRQETGETVRRKTYRILPAYRPTTLLHRKEQVSNKYRHAIRAFSSFPVSQITNRNRIYYSHYRSESLPCTIVNLYLIRAYKVVNILLAEGTRIVKRMFQTHSLSDHWTGNSTTSFNKTVYFFHFFSFHIWKGHLLWPANPRPKRGAEKLGLGSRFGGFYDATLSTSGGEQLQAQSLVHQRSRVRQLDRWRRGLHLPGALRDVPDAEDAKRNR